VTTLPQLLAGRRHVLLDFDGPVCSIFGSLADLQVANALRDVVAGYTAEFTESVTSAHDPFEVLRFAGDVGVDCLAQTEAVFQRWEIDAAAVAPETQGMRAALDAFASSGRSVTIVSNNSSAAISFFIQKHAIESYIAGVIGRVPSQPALLKPNPHLLAQALQERKATPRDSLFIGDSLSDIEAGTTLGIPVVAFANRPGKRKQFEAHHAALVIDSMWALSGT
jgi:phosphoglycolate phosphatase-like HAD superfamily hydrolase